MNNACRKVFDYIYNLSSDITPRRFTNYVYHYDATEHSNTPRFAEYAPIPKYVLRKPIVNVIKRIHRHRDRKQLPFIHAVEL